MTETAEAKKDAKRTDVWKVLAVCSCVLSLAILVFSLVLGGCETCIETAAGACVPMKCHWTFRAIAAIAAIAAASSVGWFFVPGSHGRHLASITTVFTGLVMLLCLYTPLMGLCVKSDMLCHSHARVVAILAACLIVVCVVACCKAGGVHHPKPKTKL